MSAEALSARIEDEVARVTLDALQRESGSILVFLPGQGEIRRVAEILEARVQRLDVDIAPLYGALDSRAQDLAIAPAPAGTAQDRARDLDRRDVAHH